MKLPTKLAVVLLAIWGFLTGRSKHEREPVLEDGGGGDSRAELIVALLLLAAAGCAVMFIVVYALDWSNQTQWLGLCLGRTRPNGSASASAPPWD